MIRITDEYLEQVLQAPSWLDASFVFLSDFWIHSGKGYVDRLISCVFIQIGFIILCESSEPVN